jgi:hypothetical protein
MLALGGDDPTRAISPRCIGHVIDDVVECPKFVVKLRTCLILVRKIYTNIGRRRIVTDLKTQIVAHMDAADPGRVWVPTDFSHLGNRDAVDKALQRLVAADQLRRIDRGLYDRPKMNNLTKKVAAPDYRAIVDAIARRDQLRLLVDGMTAANDLGLTDAVPAHVTIHTDARRQAIQLDQLTINFKVTAPSRLYWASRPAMRVVQALYWLKDMLPSDKPRIIEKLSKLLDDPAQGDAIRQDLSAGFNMLPAWMQAVVRELPGCDPQAGKTVAPAAGSAKRRPRAETFA